MNNILIVAATAAEIAPLLEEEKKGRVNNIDFLITGVGMVATAFALGKKLQEKRYDLAINLGIGGSFNRSLSLGDVVFVKEDNFSELGAEDGDAFLPITQLGFGKNQYKSEISNLAQEWIKDLKPVSGITVNTVHGNDSQISRLLHIWPADIESMEGAAFYYACEQEQIPCVQVRSISNYIEKRNRENWKIGLAIKVLNDWVLSKMTLT